MSLFTCAEVYYGWDDVATPDDIDLLVRLDRTTHELYPALRELILLYDVVANNRSYEFVIGTADYVSVSPEKDDIISIELDPIHFKSERQQMIDGLESVLETAFHKKDEKSSKSQRREALSNIQLYLEQHGGTTDVDELYNVLACS